MGSELITSVVCPNQESGSLSEGVQISDCIHEIRFIVWHRSHEFKLNGEQVRQDEEFYLCPCDEFDAFPIHLEDGDERTGFLELRGWSFNDNGSSSEVFDPATLFAELERLIDGEMEGYPVRVGT